jgi:hypothetical protein
MIAAAAALTGLLFVAVSINLALILKDTKSASAPGPIPLPSAPVPVCSAARPGRLRLAGAAELRHGRALGRHATLA